MAKHTGMVYPSRPLSADNDGAFACSLPLHTHPAFKTVDAHETDGRSRWLFLKHPTNSAAFTDLSSLKIYLADLHDPAFRFEDHDDPEKVEKHKHIIDLAHAHYKFCITHHGHHTTPVQTENSIQLVPERNLHRLVFHDPSGLDPRLKFPREQYRIGKLFPCDYYADAARGISSYAPSDARSASSSSCASHAPTASSSAASTEGPWFLLSDGQICRNADEAEQALRDAVDGPPLKIRLVDTLADAQNLRKARESTGGG
ncbi:hypothetical protein B0H16DRAFT_1736801 [Mycena metata]|uniref:Uncharacterized protein n=1 Tax=Mycena metata TaxID=1033252 RepID=A0AAD7MMG8_9AGAR|nr:hypothetical protein B0H16DRAFT_1736801 [Mycena metata]